MADYGASDTSTTALGTNQFPISEAWVPNAALTAVEGIAQNTDAGGKKSTAVRMGLKDGDDITQGVTTDAAVTGDNAGTLSAKLRGLTKIFTSVWDSTLNLLAVKVQAAISGGSTPFHVLSAASNNATLLKGSTGNIYGFSLSNTNAAARWVKFYNKATAPVPASDNALIVLSVQVPGNATVLAAFPEGMSLGTGIGFAAVVNASDTDNTSIGAGDLSIDIRYK